MFISRTHVVNKYFLTLLKDKLLSEALNMLAIIFPELFFKIDEFYLKTLINGLKCETVKYFRSLNLTEFDDLLAKMKNFN